MNGPALELSPPSIRSPAALPAPSSPFSASETGAEPAASLRGGPATPPRAGVDRRDDTPIPSPRPGTTTDDPPATYQRPRAFRTLQWSFLPSRSARVVANRHPLVDRELNDEERQWVEVSGKVPDDGTTRDRWDNPIGTGGDWGRTVLSPIVTETETSSSSRPHPQHSSWSSTRSAHPYPSGRASSRGDKNEQSHAAACSGDAELATGLGHADSSNRFPSLGVDFKRQRSHGHPGSVFGHQAREQVAVADRRCDDYKNGDTNGQRRRLSVLNTTDLSNDCSGLLLPIRSANAATAD
ncbi:hypothetical protein JCM3774_004192 [Rhodotorula dairenensis]